VTDEPRKNERKTRGKPFGPGNPGKPKGSRHKTTLFAEKLMQDDAEKIVKAVIDAAGSGDMTAARLILDRICPAPKGRAIQFDLPNITSIADLASALAAIVSEMAAGKLTPDEASTVAGVLEFKRKALETLEIERRLAALEQREKEKDRR
jgi:hypothetical protein